jgi:RimJ/RimL family protein N-acetyltransferase
VSKYEPLWKHLQADERDKLKAKRLYLRPFIANDGVALYDYLSDAETVKFEPYPPFTKDEAEKEAVRRADDRNFWAVCLNDGVLIGNLYFAEGGYDSWEIGYVFNRKYWGNGYAAESLCALLNFVFVEMAARRVTANCNPLNAASWRLLERVGFRREGHLVKNIYFRMDDVGDPVWQDTYEYAILANEWENL